MMELWEELKMQQNEQMNEYVLTIVASVQRKCKKKWRWFKIIFLKLFVITKVPKKMLSPVWP